MVHHYLFECKAHDFAHYKLARKLGLKAKSLRYLLRNRRAFVPLFRFVRESEKFKASYGNVALLLT